MKIDFCQSKERWDDFLKSNSGSFLQSFDWGEFKKDYQKVWRLRAIDNTGKILGVCQIFEEKNPLGNYLYIPYGPVYLEKKAGEELIKETGSKLGKGFAFIKIEPTTEILLGTKSPHRIQPQKTLVSDIKEKEEEILADFRKSTRYSVRTAIKKGVKVEISSDIDTFYQLLENTKERQGFDSYPKDYFQNLLNKTNCKLFIATHEGDPVATSIIYFFGNTVTFLHAASDHKKKQLNAVSLIIFKSIDYARREGCTKYDFWGIDEKKYPGVTLFKKGFGGEEILYPPTRDIPLKKARYAAYHMASKIIKK